MWGYVERCQDYLASQDKIGNAFMHFSTRCKSSLVATRKASLDFWNQNRDWSQMYPWMNLRRQYSEPVARNAQQRRCQTLELLVMRRMLACLLNRLVEQTKAFNNIFFDSDISPESERPSLFQVPWNAAASCAGRFCGGKGDLSPWSILVKHGTAFPRP